MVAVGISVIPIMLAGSNLPEHLIIPQLTTLLGGAGTLRNDPMIQAQGKSRNEYGSTPASASRTIFIQLGCVPFSTDSS